MHMDETNKNFWRGAGPGAVIAFLGGAIAGAVRK
jgi:hypothetical protein